MLTKKPPMKTPDEKGQSERFIETARALECDEDEAAFDEKLKRIATAKPKPSSTNRPRKRRPPSPSHAKVND
jgi:hypothetical protein